MPESMRKMSRVDYTSEKQSLDAINCGSLARIADAVELMAKDRKNLEWRMDCISRENASLREANAKMRRRNSALKGVIGRLKRQIAAQEEQQSSTPSSNE